MSTNTSDVVFYQSNHSNNVQNLDTLPIIDNNISRSVDLSSCTCGKQCKGLKGIKAHHRSCKKIESFNKEIVNDLNSQDIIEDHVDIDSDVFCETPSLKTGIKLPTNDKQWEMATVYIKANINSGEVSSADNINNCTENVHEIVCNYFAESHGKVDNVTNNEKELIQKNKNLSKQQLKSEPNKQKRGSKWNTQIDSTSF